MITCVVWLLYSYMCINVCTYLLVYLCKTQHMHAYVFLQTASLCTRLHGYTRRHRPECLTAFSFFRVCVHTLEWLCIIQQVRRISFIQCIPQPIWLKQPHGNEVHLHSRSIVRQICRIISSAMQERQWKKMFREDFSIKFSLWFHLFWTIIQFLCNNKNFKHPNKRCLNLILGQSPNVFEHLNVLLTIKCEVLCLSLFI